MFLITTPILHILLLFAGLASSSSPLHQSDDLDLVPIGPGGVFLIEVKHWDAAWINDNRATADAEAEKLTAKAKRLAGRVKRALTNNPKTPLSLSIKLLDHLHDRDLQSLSRNKNVSSVLSRSAARLLFKRRGI